MASGANSHAGGHSTVASGSCSYTEGFGTKASNFQSHAEGDCTIASGVNSHVQGKYNIEDTENKYAHIVGNGTGNKNRSNAHTVDWDGNGWYAGKLTQEGTPTEEKDLATKKYVDDGLSTKLTSPQTANVGQIFRVQAVNEDGTLTIEAVNMPSGGDVTDVTVDGQSILGENGVAEIPFMTTVDYGVAKAPASNEGIAITPKHEIIILPATTQYISNRTGYSKNPITPTNVDYAVAAVMGAPIGDGMIDGVFHYPAWSEETQAAARKRMGIGDWELIEEITLTEDSSVRRDTTPTGESYTDCNFKDFMLYITNENGTGSKFAYMYRKNDALVLTLSLIHI